MSKQILCMGTNQIHYLGKLSKNQKQIYKKLLLSKGKSICLGKLCKGNVKKLTEFYNNDYEICRICRFNDVWDHNNYTLKYIYMKVKCDRKYNRDIMKQYKELKKMSL